MKIGLIFGLLFLFLSSAKAQVSCAQADWTNLGWQQGLTGGQDESAAIRASCGYPENAEQLVIYRGAYATGNMEYCQLASAHEYGRVGSEYHLNVCPASSRDQLLVTYESGKRAGEWERCGHWAGLAISLMVFLTAFFLRRRLRWKVSDGQKVNSVVWAFSLIALAIGIFFRLRYANAIASGNYIYEEINALKYVHDMLSGTQTMTGATNMTYLVFEIIWKSVFGHSLMLDRFLVGTLNLAGLIFLYFAVKNLIDRSSALLAVGLASVSLYACHFARLAVETSWPLPFFAASLFLYSKILKGSHVRLFAFLLGLCIALGIFTYPGYTIWVLPASAVLLLIQLRERKFNFSILSFLSLGFLLYFIPTIAFHFSAQSAAPLFRGGGAAPDFSSYWPALQTNLHDLFLSGDSYYLHQGGSFIEAGLLGFFLIGVWRLVIHDRRHWAMALIVSMLAIPFLSALAFNYPGIRRGITLLLPYYLFAGAGITVFFDLLAQMRPLLRMAGYAACFSVLVLSTGSLAQSASTALSESPHDKFAKLLQMPEFKDWLENENFVVVVNGYGSYTDFIARYFDVYVNLLEKFSGIQAKNFSVRNGQGYFPPDLNSKKYTLIVDGLGLLQLLQSNHCVSESTLLSPAVDEFYLVKAGPCSRFF